MRDVTKNEQRRYLVQGAHAGLTLVLLAGAVFAASAVGLPAVGAIFVGGTVAGAVSHFVGQRFLPKAPAWSDEERVRLARVRPMWLPLGAAAVLAVHFGARLSFAVSGTLVILTIAVIVAFEWRGRAMAERRLRSAEGTPGLHER
jgi:hypothetical protein